MKKNLLLLFSIVFSINSFANAKLNVVTTSPILEDITQNIGQDKINVTSMIKRNQNPHSYEPSFADIEGLYNADIFIMNGLNLENWVKRSIQQSNFKGKAVTASEGIKVIEGHAHHHDDDGHDNHHHGDIDPHIWQNPLNGIIMAQNIAAALIEKDPENENFYTENLEQYKNQLQAIDQEIIKTLNALPQPLKAIIFHDSFAYFTARYPIEFFPVLDAHSHHEPSAKAFAKLKNVINDNQILVVFSESIENSRLVNTIVNDYKIKNGGLLITDSIDEIGKKCDSYIKIFECNLETFNKAFIQ